MVQRSVRYYYNGGAKLFLAIEQEVGLRKLSREVFGSAQGFVVKGRLRSSDEDLWSLSLAPNCGQDHCLSASQPDSQLDRCS